MRRSARVLGDECCLLILRDLECGPRRFGELLGSAAGNTRLLSSRLRRLQDARVIERRVVSAKPRGTAYALTVMGQDLMPAIHLLRSFGERWLPDCQDPRGIGRQPPGTNHA